MSATLVLTAVGMGLGFLNGRKQDQRMAEMAEAQYQQDQINHLFTWQEVQDQYTYQ